MIGLILALLLPFLALTSVAFCARRALPLALGGAAFWITMRTDQVALSIIASLCVIGLSSWALDRLVQVESARRSVILVECGAGACFAMIAALAVFGSAGVRDGMLALLVIGSGGLAATSAFGFRERS